LCSNYSACGTYTIPSTHQKITCDGIKPGLYICVQMACVVCAFSNCAVGCSPFSTSTHLFTYHRAHFCQ
jgi:hypothetical protein